MYDGVSSNFDYAITEIGVIMEAVRMMRLIACKDVIAEMAAEPEVSLDGLDKDMIEALRALAAEEVLK